MDYDAGNAVGAAGKWSRQVVLDKEDAPNKSWIMMQEMRELMWWGGTWIIRKRNPCGEIDIVRKRMPRPSDGYAIS